MTSALLSLSVACMTKICLSVYDLSLIITQCGMLAFKVTGLLAATLHGNVSKDLGISNGYSRDGELEQ